MKTILKIILFIPYAIIGAIFIYLSMIFGGIKIIWGELDEKLK